MPTSQESSLKKIGVIAGGGSLPARLLNACDKAGTEVFVVGFEGQTDRLIMQGRKHMFTRLGAAGRVMRTLKSNGVRDLVMIGSIRRPSLVELRPDLRAIRFFARLGMRALGDDSLLSAVRHELEREGFTLHGVQNFVGNLIAAEGPVGQYKPKKSDWTDIRRGLDVAQAIGRMDIGQAAVVQEGIVLGVEGVEGTNELIRRCGLYKREGRGPVLVKTCKPGQDRDLDLPTVGPDTAVLCAEAGYSGIVLQAGASLLLDPEKIAGIADKHKMFVIAVDPVKAGDGQ